MMAGGSTFYTAPHVLLTSQRQCALHMTECHLGKKKAWACKWGFPDQTPGARGFGLWIRAYWGRYLYSSTKATGQTKRLKLQKGFGRPLDDSDAGVGLDHV